MFSGIAGIFVGIARISSSTVVKLPFLSPPIAYKLPSASATAVYFLGVGILAFVNHVLVSGSYSSTKSRSPFSLQPPIVNTLPFVSFIPKNAF